MAFKASLFILACFILVATKATASTKEMAYGGQAPLKPPCDHAVAPAHSSPANPTSHAPTPAPTPTPTSSPPAYPTPHAPTTSPSSAPPTVLPGVPLPPTRTHMNYCVPGCKGRCIMLRDAHPVQRLKIRPCVHVCTACCEKHRPLCVPTATAPCPLWTTVLYHNGTRTCP